MSITKNEEVYGFVRADGPRIVNGRGEPFLLRGVGFGSWLLPEGYMWRFPEGGDRPRRIENMIKALIGDEQAEEFWETYYRRYIAEEDIVTIAKEGFNSVRLPINARFLTGEGPGPSEATAKAQAAPMAEGAVGDKDATESARTNRSDDHGSCSSPAADVIGIAPDHDRGGTAPPVFREDRLHMLDTVIGWCREHRLYVILDLHGAPGGQTGTNIDDSEFDRPELFTDERRLRESVEIWRMLAERYREEWIVAGYDLLNEPLPEWFAEYNDQVIPLYKEMIAAIRGVDERHMIILEGVHWSTDWSIFEHAFGDEPIDTNVLLQFHKYWNNPDTESISKYLAFRDRHNVPIFMGEGGENNKDWYAGAFRMFDDHDISWNFWTWKKLDTNNSPCSIRKPERWGLLVDYLQGGAKPEAAAAKSILWEYLDNLALSRCDYRPEVVRSLLRRAPVRIPAVFYGYKGEGVSFGLSKRNGHGEAILGATSENGSEKLTSPTQGGVQFRISDQTRIAFVQSERAAANFAHGGGEEWAADDWLCVELSAGAWLLYDFELNVQHWETPEGSALPILLRLLSPEGSGKLRMSLDGGGDLELDVCEREWHTCETTLRDIPVSRAQRLRLTCLEGSIRLMWLIAGETPR